MLVDTLDLGGSENAFARGGNRLCFVHPKYPDQCVKVLRPDRTPEIKRQERRFPRNLKPLRYFDDNYQEFKVYQLIEKHIGEAAFQLIPRCFGEISTNWGTGLVSEIIKDEDGLVSLSLKQYLWVHGKTDTITRAVADFIDLWSRLGMPSRNLLLHNLVVQTNADGIRRIVAIDGLGWPDVLPLAYFVNFLARKKARRKAQRLWNSIDELLHKKAVGGDWGYHGWMDDQQRRLVSGESP
ncbi:hypothetical protein MAH1_19530 [Sessilibacter sp. MAH1]